MYFFKLFQYEDPVRQEAARKTVPEDELEEKALVSLAKVSALYILHCLVETISSDNWKILDEILEL